MWISALNFLTDIGSSLASTAADVASSEVTAGIIEFTTWAWTSVVETIFP